MFKLDIKRRVEPEQKTLNPSSFDDPLAKSISWSPMKQGGANFRTHKLIQVEPNRIEFHATLGMILFCCSFIIGGLLMMTVVPMVSRKEIDYSIWKHFWTPFLFGLFFGGAGGWMLYYFSRRIIFDKNSGEHWVGKLSPRQVFDTKSLTNYTELKDIHALQIISEYISGEKRSYYSYELNIVLKDGTRLNVIDHGNKKKMLQDTKTLGEFLNVPVWDASL